MAISKPRIPTTAYTTADLGASLPLLASGKVRELYKVDSKTLLFVASDRISAYDVIMQNVRSLSNPSLHQVYELTMTGSPEQRQSPYTHDSLLVRISAEADP